MKDWKSETPFPQHWLVYFVVKIAVLVLALYLAFRTYEYL
jgi:hypothetical protein